MAEFCWSENFSRAITTGDSDAINAATVKATAVRCWLPSPPVPGDIRQG